MFNYLKKGISTPIAIGVILVLAVLVGGFTLWQFREILRETTELSEIEISEEKEEITEENGAVKCSNFKFEDYPVTKKYKGKIAEVDFESAPQYYNFYTVITNGAKEGPNFAGKYTIVTWGCGAPCQNNIIIDSQTGKILDGFFSAWGSDYNIDSILLISDVGAYKETAVEYYEFKDGKLNLVCKVGDGELEEKTADWKTYRNEDYGFEVKYPKRDEISFYEDSASFDHSIEEIPFPCVGHFWIRIWDNPSQFSIIDFVFEKYGLFISSQQFLQDITVNAIKGVQVTKELRLPPGGGAMRNSVFLPQNSQIYEIAYSPDYELMGSEEAAIECVNELGKVFSKMLSTFNFLD